MKLMLALVLACTLAACGSQEIAAKQEAAPQQETAPQQAAICAEPMGISVEKLLLNIDAGLVRLRRCKVRILRKMSVAIKL